MTGAGDLSQRVTFAAPLSGSDGAGGVEDGFEDKFTVWAAYIHLRSSEAVMAARLEGRHSQVIRIRASSQARQITTDWRACDARTMAVFNVRDVTFLEDRAWVDVLVQGGVAA